MAISLELPKKLQLLEQQAQQVANEVLRPISRKYDLAEHAYPKELDMLAALIDGMNDSGSGSGAGASGASKDKDAEKRSAPAEGDGNRNGANLASVLGVTGMCWGDVGLLLSMPRQGLGNSAISAVATEEQKERFAGKWAAMAITEPEAGSDSAAIRTTATLEGDEYVINGEKIYVTAGDRADLIVVWATLDPKLGRAAIKSFVVARDNPGLKLDRLEHKLGIKASDTANFILTDCRVPKEDLLGNPEIDTKKSFGGVMETFDNTRPLVAGMAVGLAQACLEETKRILAEAGVEIDYDRPINTQAAAAAEFIELEADYEAARLLMLEAAWMADNRKPNSLQASYSKAKAGRTATDVALRCVALCGSIGYSETSLLEKWARDAKILDIFEGTQQIQLLIIARQLLKKTSAELL
ncbi:MAG: acyl-CoA dehydrogenase family protein [Thermoleophilia bacterium]|nr:acyl-CoA dehydrogenase family protein [Thermoleophilia bacterium]